MAQRITRDDGALQRFVRSTMEEVAATRHTPDGLPYGQLDTPVIFVSQFVTEAGSPDDEESSGTDDGEDGQDYLLTINEGPGDLLLKPRVNGANGPRETFTGLACPEGGPPIPWKIDDWDIDVNHEGGVNEGNLKAVHRGTNTITILATPDGPPDYEDTELRVIVAGLVAKICAATSLADLQNDLGC